MEGKKLEKEVEEAVEAIEIAAEEIGDVAEILNEKTNKSTKKKKGKEAKENELAVKVLATMKTLQADGVTEFTSTLLRDKVGTKNRGAIRRVMSVLEEAGQVVITEKKFGKRKQFRYKLA